VGVGVVEPDGPVPQATENMTPTIIHTIRRREGTGTELLIRKWRAKLGLELLETRHLCWSKVNFSGGE
jgi:hypothetical protein